jgi:beta-phosphoglucomutase-like phosphatase (HAD superfamily)
VGALIFDFDGVIADSEAIANTVLAETVTSLGHSTTLDQALARYSGRRSKRRADGRCLPTFPASSRLRRWTGSERI